MSHLWQKATASQYRKGIEILKTLRDIAEKMHDYRLSLNFSVYTESRVRPMLKLFFEFIEKNYSVTTASDLKSHHFYAYQEHISKLINSKGIPITPGSRNNRIAAVKSLGEFMHRRGYTLGDISDNISYVKTPSLLSTSVLNHKQIKKVISQVDTRSAYGYRDRTILELLYSTGVRNAELMGLSVGNIDLDYGTIRILGKGKKERVVPVGHTALQWLTSYIKGVRPYLLKTSHHQEVFLNCNGEPMKGYTLRRMIHKYAKKARLETVVTPHTFRRSCATEMIRANANLYHVKELLGHEKLDTLKSYTKLTINDLRATHEKCHPREQDES